jgi:F0F1-type ATP synthase assembly protein I
MRDQADGLSIGLEMGASVLIGWYLGKLFDDACGTEPWGMVFFLVAGFGAAFKAVWRTYQKAKKVMMRPEPGVVVARQTRQTGADSGALHASGHAIRKEAA